MRNYLGVIILLLALVSGWAISNKNWKEKEPIVSINGDFEGHDNKKSVSQRLRENEHLSVEKRIELFYQLKKDSLEFFNFENEDELTMYGYGFLWDGKVDEAIAIFKLLVAEFPESANTYDSLGEAYLAKGKKELALENYQRTLSMNPDNFYAVDQIERIINPDFVELTSKEKFSKVYSLLEYKQDLDLLGKKLEEVHPNVFKFISRTDFWKLIDTKKSQLTEQTTFAEFDWYCQEIVASLSCSHTSAGSFRDRMEMLPDDLRFPIQVRYIDEKLYVIDPLNNKTSLRAKDEILAINNVPVKEIIDQIYRTIPSQGDVTSSKRLDFNFWAVGMIPYALGFPETYKVQLVGIESDVFLTKSVTTKDPIKDSAFYSCNGNICLEFQEDDRIAVMTISSFNYYAWNNLDEFELFIDESFEKIHEKGTQNLVIDLRFNGGGSPESSIYLLRYLIDQPFIYFVNSEYNGAKGEHQPFKNGFRGKNYFIIDGHGNSTTGHFMSFVKKYNLGITVGEELGSNHFCTAGQKVCRLPNTKLVFNVANATSISNVNGLPDEKGILPDHYVTQGVNDYLNVVDAVKNYTIGLIE